MIAVYVNGEGSSASLKEEGCVKLFSNTGEGWKAVREVPFLVEGTAGVAQMRRAVSEMVEQLKDCHIFVAKEVVGQLYYVLEANGFEAFEAEGKPEEFLNSIQEAVQTVSEEKKDDVKATPESWFEKTEKEGYYFLNLKKALKLDCALSSKKLLLPFLRSKDFLGLDMICDHLPRWLEDELKILKLNSEVSKLKENEYKVSITI
jgi:Fe-only nitrogenase accessory protein AnfO